MIIGIQKGTIILTATHILVMLLMVFEPSKVISFRQGVFIEGMVCPKNTTHMKASGLRVWNVDVRLPAPRGRQVHDYATYGA